MSSLEAKIANRTARVGIVGLGYVGLPLAVEYAKAGFSVTGIDLSTTKTDSVNAGKSYIGDIHDDELAPLVAAGKLRATTDFSAIADLDTVNICVPTPLRKTKDPDMSYIVAATQDIAKYFHPGMLIILESTTYPGTTDELVLPMLEKTGLKVGVDFFLCFSPERVDPGNAKFQTKNIPKVVGGTTPACTEIGRLFYCQALEKVVPVSSTQVAEMVKLLENTFRMINIGLVNEIAIMCNGMDINVWEVIEAAATKPFGFMPFYPGPGLGGHCIPIDPFYLSWKSKQAGIEARFIELAGQINGQMPHFVVEKIQNALNIMLLLQRRGALISYTDPHVPTLRLDGLELTSTKAFEDADCVVIVTDHTNFDYAGLVERAKLIVDTRNALKTFTSQSIVRL
jgi:UDP-N-acetyl-D-glucosamine dehydrogenase